MNFLQLIQWTATTLIIAGAVATSAQWQPINFWLLNAGSFLWIIVGRIERNTPLVVVNVALLAIYVLGLSRVVLL